LNEYPPNELEEGIAAFELTGFVSRLADAEARINASSLCSVRARRKDAACKRDGSQDDGLGHGYAPRAMDESIAQEN
jgi:hypothetical protein